jgi:hypothetical protein
MTDRAIREHRRLRVGEAGWPASPWPLARLAVGGFRIWSCAPDHESLLADATTRDDCSSACASTAEAGCAARCCCHTRCGLLLPPSRRHRPRVAGDRPALRRWINDRRKGVAAFWPLSGALLERIRSCWTLRFVEWQPVRQAESPGLSAGRAAHHRLEADPIVRVIRCTGRWATRRSSGRPPIEAGWRRTGLRV